MTVATTYAFIGRNKKDLSIYLYFLNSFVQQVFLKCLLDASAILTCDLTAPSPCSQGDHILIGVQWEDRINFKKKRKFYGLVEGWSSAAIKTEPGQDQEFPGHRDRERTVLKNWYR